MNKKLRELIICYVAQYGFDVIIGEIHGIDLHIVIKLKEIANE